jgi:hypothetical protein
MQAKLALYIHIPVYYTFTSYGFFVFGRILMGKFLLLLYNIDYYVRDRLSVHYVVFSSVVLTVLISSNIKVLVILGIPMQMDLMSFIFRYLLVPLSANICDYVFTVTAEVPLL